MKRIIGFFLSFIRKLVFDGLEQCIKNIYDCNNPKIL